jgi:ABC-type antimicrobial peptide transport system permease subunit
MKLLAGRYLRPTDSISEFMINENYARLLGFQHPEDAVGKMLYHSKLVPIVGILKDFNSRSTKTSIGPLVCSSYSGDYNCFHVLLKTQDKDGTVWQSAISKMGDAWKEVYPEQDFDYHFFDESIAAFYKSEQDISKLLAWATGLAILISCLGLLGLAIYTTNQRTKEIGVRKVLGATIEQIVLLLSKDFVQLILLAFAIAVPLAWWAVNWWLKDFAYRTTLDWWVFAAGGAMMLTIALGILCFRTIRAASANPVKSLRAE